MTDGRVRTLMASVGALVVAGLAAWGAGAFAVRFASDPARQPCPALLQGDRMLMLRAAGGAQPLLRFHVPPDASEPLPLVLAVHGAGRSGAAFGRASGLGALSDRDRFLVAYLEDHRAAAEGAAVLAGLERRACVDPSRVFVTGIGSGGAAAARLACTLGGGLAGIALVAGSDRPLPRCTAARPLPVLEVVPPHSAADFAGSAPRWLALWRRADRCPARRPVRFRPALGVTQVTWSHCARGTRVARVQLDGAARAWRGGPRLQPRRGVAAATVRTWRFFRSLPARSPAVR